MKRPREEAFWGDEKAEDVKPSLNAHGSVRGQHASNGGRSSRQDGDGMGKRANGGVLSSQERDPVLLDEARQMVDERIADVARLEAQLVAAREKLAKSERLLQKLDPTAKLHACSASGSDKQSFFVSNGTTSVSKARPRGGCEGAAVDGRKVKVEGGGGDEGRGGVKGHSQEAKALPKKASHGLQPPPSTKHPSPDYVDIIPLIRSKNEPSAPRLSQAVHLSSQHKRKLRTVVFNPGCPTQCITSALDGYVKFWSIQQRGRDLELRFSTDCSTKEKRWPESLAWHASGEQLVATFATDGEDAQVALLENKNKPPLFLKDRPHDKGVINSVEYMPWDESVQFATAGSDHLVALWTHREDGLIEVKKLHKNVHTAAVSGAAGLLPRRIIVSCGMDKRVVGWDLRTERAAFVHMLDCKASAILPNPVDHNLLLVQTGTPGQQLRLFDIRAPKVQMHAFGWEQKSSDSQSALITPSWSPDGLFVTAGSADPVINVFDIRYNSRQPASTVGGHSKRVFKALWHSTYPLIISISSDLNIGLHRVG